MPPLQWRPIRHSNARAQQHIPTSPSADKDARHWFRAVIRAHQNLQASRQSSAYTSAPGHRHTENTPDDRHRSRRPNSTRPDPIRKNPQGLLWQPRRVGRHPNPPENRTPFQSSVSRSDPGIGTRTRVFRAGRISQHQEHNRPSSRKTLQLEPQAICDPFPATS